MWTVDLLHRSLGLCQQHLNWLSMCGGGVTLKFRALFQNKTLYLVQFNKIYKLPNLFFQFENVSFAFT